MAKYYRYYEYINRKNLVVVIQMDKKSILQKYGPELETTCSIIIKDYILKSRWYGDISFLTGIITYDSPNDFDNILDLRIFLEDVYIDRGLDFYEFHLKLFLEWDLLYERTSNDVSDLNIENQSLEQFLQKCKNIPIKKFNHFEIESFYTNLNQEKWLIEEKKKNRKLVMKIQK